jgi:hypothetical protein
LFRIFCRWKKQAVFDPAREPEQAPDQCCTTSLIICTPLFSRIHKQYSPFGKFVTSGSSRERDL